MRKLRTLSLITLFLPFTAAGQTDTGSIGTPYNPKGLYHSFSIKGKILPWFIGDDAGISGLLGFEYGFAKNQSIGIDGFAYLQESSHDNVQDTAGVTHDVGQDWNSFERALFLNYRYYFNMPRLRSKGYVPYLVVFMRYGKIDRRYDPLYPLNYYYEDHERHYSAGLLIGTTITSTDYSNDLGWDINLGLFEKQKEIDSVYLTHGVISHVNTRPLGLGFRLSVNLVWWWNIHSSARKQDD